MPSSDLSFSLPINPLRREKIVSAAVTSKLRKHSRVWLYTQYVILFIHPPTSATVRLPGVLISVSPRKLDASTQCLLRPSQVRNGGSAHSDMDVNDDCYPCSGRSIYEAMRPSASPLITEMPGGDVARHAAQKTAYRTTLP